MVSKQNAPGSAEKKRGVEESESAEYSKISKTVQGQLKKKDDDEEMLEFEDMWEDELESDDEVEHVDDDEDMMDQDMEEEQVQVYLPGQSLAEDEELVADPSTYDMLHSLQVEWPCLSFDILHDTLGSNRSSYPMTSYFVAGSQADIAKNNKLYIMKLSSLYKTKVSLDSDDEESDNEDLDEDPILEYKTVSHSGGVNRLRLLPHTSQRLVASMSDNGSVYINDISSHIQALDTPGLVPSKAGPLSTITAHGKNEGYAVDWSPLKIGSILTGDTASHIYLSHCGASFSTEDTPFAGHTSSVEDLQWSPQQQSVFASCSADKTIKIWDVRDKKSAKLSVVAHDSDVNVISWNRSVDYLLASGSDSGQFSIWDLRKWPSACSTGSTPDPAATFKWHRGPITSLEWNPHESSVLAVSGADDQLTLWDLALERDQEEETVTTIIPGGQNESGKKVEVPPQLLFIHQGQRHMKELHWHKQIPGVILSTAFDGFNIFKTINS